MSDLQRFVDEMTQIINQDKAPANDVRRLMLEMDEFFNTPAFQTLSYEDRARLQNGYKELRNLARGQQEALAVSSGLDDLAPVASGSVNRARIEAREHNPYAEQQMEEAEKLFYGGRYAESIKLYDQVLQIEPLWERAQKHRGESENYLRTGYIPSVALPADAGTAFGKAQSAARLGRFSDAMALLNKAQAILRELGIQRWQEGQEFEQKLQQSIDAESVYQEGIQLFNQGQVDEAIDRIETAARATGLPKYNDKAQEMRRVKATVQSIGEALNATTADVKIIAQTKADLDGLLLQYDQNPVFLKLKTRLESIALVVTEPLKDEIRSLKTQAERSQTLDAVQNKARQARQVIDQARSLGKMDEAFNLLQEDIDKILREVQKYKDDLQQANIVLNTNRSWPSSASRMSQEVRGRYPNDPGVIELNKGLAGYRATLAAIKGGIAILAIVILGSIIFYAYTQVQSYYISLTPTVTPTETATLEPTGTATFTPTFTPLPPTLTPTLLPSITPTPMYGTVARTVWARAGCYEGYDAFQRIPEGGQVRFLPSERRFDKYNRECTLVEYYDGKVSVIGWILFLDLAP